MLHLSYVITGLYIGGAEHMLFKLLSQLDRDQFSCEVISLLAPGPVGDRIAKLGVPVHNLGMSRGLPNPYAFLKLVKLLRQSKPQIIHTWMYHADLMGGLAAFFSGRPAVIWSIRQSDLSRQHHKSGTLLTAKTCAVLSRILPAKIVTNSRAGMKIHANFGYQRSRMRVIPNGFDTSLNHPDETAPGSLRRELGLPADTLLIGMVARYHEVKDHETFLRAAGILIKTYPKTQFILCGDGISLANDKLKTWIHKYSLDRNIHLLGRRDDIPELNAALDIASLSSSFGEGFPNVIGEAMACGVPCVATAVGDTADIIADTGVTVPVRDAHALASAWTELIDSGGCHRKELGRRARHRIIENYSLDAVCRQYQELYLELSGKREPQIREL